MGQYHGKMHFQTPFRTPQIHGKMRFQAPFLTPPKHPKLVIIVAILLQDALVLNG